MYLYIYIAENHGDYTRKYLNVCTTIKIHRVASAILCKNPHENITKKKMRKSKKKRIVIRHRIRMGTIVNDNKMDNG